MGKYYIKEVSPAIDLLGNVPRAAGNIVFDWTPFEIPRGTACIKSIQLVMAGLNGADVAGARDLELYFAKSIDGVAPSSLGTSGAAITAITSAACRRNMIGRCSFDGSAARGTAHLLGYNVWSLSGRPGNDQENHINILEGETNYPGTTPGYQTIFVCALADTADIDFGTAVTLNQAGHQAISTSPVDLIVTGTDADDVFAVGDELVSFVASDGTSPKQIGTITSIPDADSIVVDAVAEAFNHTTEICNRRPMAFKFGFEY